MQFSSVANPTTGVRYKLGSSAAEVDYSASADPKSLLQYIKRRIPRVGNSPYWRVACGRSSKGTLVVASARAPVSVQPGGLLHNPDFPLVQVS